MVRAMHTFLFGECLWYDASKEQLRVTFIVEFNVPTLLLIN